MKGIYNTAKPKALYWRQLKCFSLFKQIPISHVKEYRLGAANSEKLQGRYYKRKPNIKPHDAFCQLLTKNLQDRENYIEQKNYFQRYESRQHGWRWSGRRHSFLDIVRENLKPQNSDGQLLNTIYNAVWTLSGAEIIISADRNIHTWMAILRCIKLFPQYSACRFQANKVLHRTDLFKWTPLEI